MAAAGKTGWTIERWNIENCKLAKGCYVPLSSIYYLFQLQARSGKKFYFLLPSLVIIKTEFNYSNEDVNDLFDDIFDDVTDVLFNSMKMEEVFKRAHDFTKKFFNKTQIELNKFGLRFDDFRSQNYFMYLNVANNMARSGNGIGEILEGEDEDKIILLYPAEIDAQVYPNKEEESERFIIVGAIPRDGKIDFGSKPMLKSILRRIRRSSEAIIIKGEIGAKLTDGQTTQNSKPMIKSILTKRQPRESSLCDYY